jgi:hypothetical protein
MEQLLTPSGQCWVFPTPPDHIDTPSFVPQAIAQALARAIRVQDFTLGPIHRLALCVIVGFADKQVPEQPIYIRKTTLGGYIGRSLPQLRRYLADLEADGWIERHQYISRAAGAQVGSITLTAKSIAAFFPSEPGPAKPAKRAATAGQDAPVDKSADVNRSRRSSTSGAIQDPLKQCLSRHLAEREGFVQQPEEAEAHPKRAEDRAQAIWRVPEPLRWLCEQAKVSPWGVFSLMRQAKQMGTTLEVVANCIRGSLQSARNAYAYIHRVLSEDRDWNQYAERVEARALAQAEKAAAEQIRVERLRKIQAIDGQAFRHADTGRIYQVYGNAASVFESIEQLRKGVSLGGVLSHSSCRTSRIRPCRQVRVGHDLSSGRNRTTILAIES